jgi:dihydroflavonol-4-reductase
MSDTQAARSETVLVTGGSGFIAAFVIAQLLREGYAVNTTVRSLAREAEVRATIGKLADPGNRLKFFAADLNSDAGWADAVAGCTYVQHVASPLPTISPKDDDELVRPARDGALRVLKAARDAGATRVVMTASAATIAYGTGGRAAPPYTEADWTDATNRTDTSPYERSKTIAERAVRDWMARGAGALELVTIHPGLVLGPVLSADFSASVEAIKKLLEGSVPGVPRFGWPIVDVRDIADLHIRAMTAQGVAGERFIGAGDFWWMSQMAEVLKRRLGPKAKKVPSMKIPDFVVRISAMFDPVVRDRLFELGKSRPVSHEKATRVLGWTPRSNEEAIVATAESLIALGLV